MCPYPPWTRAILALVASLPGVLFPSACALTAAPVADLELGGRRTRIDLHLPDRAEGSGPRDAVVIAHGFTRSRATVTGHAAMLAADGRVAVAPDLPYLVDSRDNARALRDLVGWLRSGKAGVAVDRVVLVGFSAGGLAALLATDAPGVVGYVGLDPFDRPGGVGARAAARFAAPAVLIRAPSSPCNAFAIVAPWVEAFPVLLQDRMVESASHCDFESASDAVCEFVCGRSDAQRRESIRAGLREAVSRILDRPGHAAPAAAPAPNRP